MDNIKYYFTKVLEQITYSSSNDNLKTSICREIQNITQKLIILNNKILKTNEQKEFLQKTINDNEKIYQESKHKLQKFDNLLIKKVNQFKLEMNCDNLDETENKIDILNKKNIKILNIIKLISDKYNNLILINNENIFNAYSELNKNIEENILTCEIAKEKIQPINQLLNSLTSEKNKLEIHIKNLNTVQFNLNTD